jgi:hypothetical protein
MFIVVRLDVWNRIAKLCILLEEKVASKEKVEKKLYNAIMLD